MKKMKLCFSVMLALVGLFYAVKCLIVGCVLSALLFLIIFGVGAGLTAEVIGIRLKSTEGDYYGHK